MRLNLTSPLSVSRHNPVGFCDKPRLFFEPVNEFFCFPQLGLLITQCLISHFPNTMMRQQKKPLKRRGRKQNQNAQPTGKKTREAAKDHEPSK
ncbi:hypothetical protein DS906_06305 [Ruegeria sp. A3M17]|nr:hypothetical protein DS906_06305 [Ruegeria sp. A3M17]